MGHQRKRVKKDGGSNLPTGEVNVPGIFMLGFHQFLETVVDLTVLEQCEAEGRKSE